MHAPKPTGRVPRSTGTNKKAAGGKPAALKYTLPLDSRPLFTGCKEKGHEFSLDQKCLWCIGLALRVFIAANLENKRAGKRGSGWGGNSYWQPRPEDGGPKYMSPWRDFRYGRSTGGPKADGSDSQDRRIASAYHSARAMPLPGAA